MAHMTTAAVAMADGSKLISSSLTERQRRAYEIACLPYRLKRDKFYVVASECIYLFAERVKMNHIITCKKLFIWLFVRLSTAIGSNKQNASETGGKIKLILLD